MFALRFSLLFRFLALLPRAVVILLLLVSPLAGLQAVAKSSGATIEAPARKNSGIGFVLLVSLQRA
jgi:hypothetical protein